MNEIFILLIMKINAYTIFGWLLSALGFILIYFGNKVDSNESTETIIEETSSTVNKNTNNRVDSLQTHIDSKFDDIMSLLGLDDNSKELLKALFGENYKTVLSSKETVSQLKHDLDNMTLQEVITERNLLKRRVEKLQFKQDSMAKDEIIENLNLLRYKSARDVIDKYIHDNDNLSSKFQAELYMLKGLTYSGKELDHDKRRKFLTKAYELDKTNPEVSFHYGKLLFYNARYLESKRILEDALDLVDNGAKMEQIDLVRTLTVLGNCIFHLERNKPKNQRNFQPARKYLKMALVENSKLESKQSELHIIKKNLAEVEIILGDYDKAISLLNESIEFENCIVGDRFSHYTGFSYMNLGSAYLYKFQKSNSVDDFKQSKKAYNIALEMFKASHGINHIYVADVYSNMGNLEKQVDPKKAIPYYLTAIKIMESYQIHHADKLGSTYGDLSRCYALLKDKDNGLKYAQLALMELRQVLPENHEEIVWLNRLIHYLDGL